VFGGTPVLLLGSRLSIIDNDNDCDWAAACPQLKLLFTTAIGSFVSPPSEGEEDDDDDEEE
jgi:hypothetical protein